MTAKANQHYGHVAGDWWYGCDACNPIVDEHSIVRLRPLIHRPTKEELQAVIYQARWINGVKNAGLATDEEIAKAILEFLTK